MEPAQSEPAQPTAIGRLLYFASQGNVESVRKVLDDSPKVPVDSQDYDGRTAMHLAASEGHKGVIELLLNRNANVNPVDRWRKTPLADARRYEALHHGSKSDKRQIYQEVCNLLANNGGSTSSPFEIDADELTYTKHIRQSNFGRIELANWRGTNVQARIMDRRVEVLNSPKSDQAKLTKQLSLLQRLRHPNIVQFLGAVQTKSEPLVLVTEYLPKGNLLDLLRESKKGRLPQKEAMNYALDIARGMNYLQHHKPTVVHGDLNPMNLLRDAGGHLKVGGLHLSEIEWICKYGNDNPNQPLAYSRNLEFAWYKAPELRLSTGEKTPETSVDVYSFGVIVREMFEGRSLASRQAHKAGASRQVHRASHSAAQDAAASRLYPPDLEKILQKCCHSDPRKRPSFEKIILNLETIKNAMMKRPLFCLVHSALDNMSAMWQTCASKARLPQKSRSSVFSVESQKGVKLNPTGADEQTTCTSIPE